MWAARATPAVAVVAAVLPLSVAAIAIAVRAPVIHWAGDRALTELGVREVLRGRQLLGIGGRFGWRHPGPAWLELLVPAYVLAGHAPWSLSVGAVLLHAVMIAVAVLAATRAGGPRAGAVLAATSALYLRATGMQYWTNLWAGYAFTWPLLALIVVAAVVTSDRDAGWAVAAALLVGTLLVQTDVSTAIPVVAIGVVAFAVRLVRFGPGRFFVARRGAAVAVVVLLVAVAAAWVPPLIEQVTHHPGNMTLLIRYARQAPGGHPLRIATAAVGAALTVLPAGGRWILHPQVQADLGPGPVWALLVTLAAVAVGGAATLVGWRRRRGFAGDLALVSTVAVLAGVVSVSRIDGPINFYLLTWITVVPVAGLAAVVLVVAPAPTRWRTDPVLVGRGRGGGGGGRGRDRAARHRAGLRPGASATAASETALATSALGPATRGLVWVHVLTSDTWPDAAGVAVQLQRMGARIEVDQQWVFLFGDAFAPVRTPPSAEVWFLRPHEVPDLEGKPGVTMLGEVNGVDVYARRN